MPARLPSSLTCTLPPLLGVGARVALISPSGPLRDITELARAEQYASVFGWETIVGPHAMSRDGYFAGDDRMRANDLNAAIHDPSIDGIWCLRGGYGAARLLPTLDLDAVAARPKALIGYSDITALHSAWQHAGVVSFHGPTARGPISPFSFDSLRRAVVLGVNSAGDATNSETLRDGIVAGRLAGGNLALAASLCGTPWAINFAGAIAVFEDIHEATYRIDRMLAQLRLSGALDQCVALAFGHFTDATERADDGARSLANVLGECADIVGVPAIAGLPIGHIDDQWTLPFGALATLDTTNKRLTTHSAP